MTKQERDEILAVCNRTKQSCSQVRKNDDLWELVDNTVPALVDALGERDDLVRSCFVVMRQFSEEVTKRELIIKSLTCKFEDMPCSSCKHFNVRENGNPCATCWQNKGDECKDMWEFDVEGFSKNGGGNE